MARRGCREGRVFRVEDDDDHGGCELGKKAAGESMPPSNVLTGPASPQAFGLHAWVDDSSILVQTGFQWESNYETAHFLGSATEGWLFRALSRPKQKLSSAISSACG